MSTFSTNEKKKFFNKGFSLVEVLIGAALLILIFSGIIAGFRSALVLVGHARATSGALGLANERIEYVRGMPYDSVGTLLGIPAGTIPQNETIVLNGTSFNRRTLIQYVDAPEDGLGASDANSITADYKRIKVELTWTVRGSSRSLALVTNVIPKGIETTLGGGTLTVNVFDATAAPVANAQVRIINASTTPAIDVIAYSNAVGVVMFPGAPAASGYMISATRSGYSKDQTYSASSTNPNPNPAHVSVVAGAVSTVNFSIDRVSTRIVRTVEPPSAATTTDTLDDSTLLFSSTSVAVSGGEMVLTGSAGSYAARGGATTTVVAPSDLMSRTEVSWTGSVPPQTNTSLSVFSESGGVYTRIPDVDLPGNSVGFATSPIDLSGLSVVAYPRLALGITLESFDAADTPRVQDWHIAYTVVNTPVPSIAFSLTSSKNIGTDGLGFPVPKYAKTHTTDADGEAIVTPLEWGQYTLSVDGAAEGFDISDICLQSSLTVSPDTSATTTLTMVPHTPHSLSVGVFSPTGVPLPSATVSITSGGAPITSSVSTCGYVHFDALSSGTYDITTSASGYTTDVTTGVSVSGTTKITITPSP